MNTLRLKALVELNPVCPRFDAVSHDEDIAFVPMEGVGFNTLAVEYRTKGDVLTGYSRFEDGDVLVPKISPTFAHGRVVVASGLPLGVAAGTTEFHVLRPRPGIEPRWLRYVLLSDPFLQEGVASYYGVAGQKRISLDWLSNYRVPLVSTDSQARIADYLDVRTAEADALIQEVQDQLVLVAERRQSVLDTSLTKGLKPRPLEAVPSLWNMEVPVGWNVLPLRYAVDELTVGIVITPSRYYEDEGLPVLRGLNVRPGHVRSDDLVYMSQASNLLHAKSILREHDIVVVRTGNAGSASLVPEWAVGGNAVDLLIIRPGSGFLPKFLELALNSDLVKQQVSCGSVGALQEHFNVGALGATKIVCPPLEEQTEVVAAIERAHDDLDTLADTLKVQLRLLAEHRRAVITTAVTGEIDVEAVA